MIVLIPAYKPDNSLIRLIHQLSAHSESIQVLVIDDGSGSEYAPIFTELTLSPTPSTWAKAQPYAPA